MARKPHTQDVVEEAEEQTQQQAHGAAEQWATELRGLAAQLSEAYGANNFAPVLEVIKALISHADRMAPAGSE